MRIKIEKVESDELVQFAASFGLGKGLWCGKVKPELIEYYAEIDITITVSLDTNAAVASDKQIFIRYQNNQNEIQGLVESKDDDGLIYLRLAADCLIMIENVDESIKEGDYLLIRLDPLEFEIYAM